MNLEDKVILVTGSSSGIGKATALNLPAIAETFIYIAKIVSPAK